MKSRVLSLRLPYRTIAYCFALQKEAGRTVEGRAVGTIVSDTVEAIVEASRRMYKIPDMDDDIIAKEYILRFSDFIPGFDAVDAITAIRTLQNKVDLEVAEKASLKEKTRPAETPTQPEPAQAIPGDVDNAVKDVDYFNKNYMLQPVVEKLPEEEVVDEIEQAARAEVEKDTSALVAAIKTEVINRVSPDIAPVEVPKCPWLSTPNLGADYIGEDVVYKEAIAIDPLMGLAVRVVYVALPMEDWGTDRAIKLVKQLYKSYKEWSDLYGNAQVE